MEWLVVCPECGGIASFSTYFQCYKCSQCTWFGSREEIEQATESRRSKRTTQDGDGKVAYAT